MLDQVSKGNLA